MYFRSGLPRLFRFTGTTRQAPVIVGLALLHSLSAHAAVGDYEGKPLAAVQFSPPVQPLVPSELQARSAALKPGQPLRAADVRTAIEQMFATGRYENIVADAAFAPLPSQQVILTFITTPARFVRGVVVKGVPEPPNEGQLVNATKLQLGSGFNDTQLRQANDSVLDVLRLNGFYQAKVTSERMFIPETQQVDIVFDVTPGKRAKFEMPVFKGHPNRPVEQLVKATRWRTLFGLHGGWREATENRVQTGLDRIRKQYQSKESLMAKVVLDQVDYHDDTNTVVPVLNVESGPKVSVGVTGAKLSAGKRRQLLPMYEEQSVDKDLLVEGRRNLVEYFQAQGYFEAAADFDLTTGEKGVQVIEYSVARGPLHKLSTVTIMGNRYFDRQTIRERMYTTPATLVRFRHGRYSPDYLKRDVNAIKDLYKSNGFRDVEVDTTVEDDYQGHKEEVAVFIKIKEGPQWFVANLEINGATQEERDTLLSRVQSTPGQPFSDLNVANDQETVLNYFFNDGYPSASFEANVKPSATPNQMDLIYTIKPGTRLYVRDVLISGLENSDPALVRSRIQNLDKGSPLSQASVIESQRRLYDLGIFARVDTALQNPDGEEENKYVLYRLEEARKYSVTGGVGAQVGRIGGGNTNTFDAPGGTAGFSPRVSLGLTRSNFLGIGHTVGVQTRFSDVQKRVVFNYLAPRFRGEDDLNLTFTALYDDSHDVRTFDAKRQEASVQLGQRISRAISIQYRIGYRRVTVDENSLKISPALIPILSQPVQLGIISTTFVQDRRDDPIDSHKGMYNTVDLAIASNLIGSKTSFARGLLRNATYHRIGKDLVLARSLSVGVMERLSAADVPLPERFFAGGSSSHRGFPENQAGPRDLFTGFPLGGKALLMNSTELRFPLIGDNIGGIIFHDAGNVYSNIRNLSFRYSQRSVTDFDYMVQAAGVGIRYRTPVGPIRVDLGYALNPPSFIGFKGSRDQLLAPVIDPSLRVYQRLNHFQFHFSLGQTF